MLADAVNFADIRAAAQKSTGDLLFLVQGQIHQPSRTSHIQRIGKQGGTTAGDAVDHQRFGVGAGGKLGNTTGGVEAILIRDGMPRLNEFDPFQVGSVAVLHAHHPLFNPFTKNIFKGLRHRTRSFACSQKNDPLVVLQVEHALPVRHLHYQVIIDDADMAGDHRIGIHPVESDLEYLGQFFPHAEIIRYSRHTNPRFAR